MSVDIFKEYIRLTYNDTAWSDLIEDLDSYDSENDWFRNNEMLNELYNAYKAGINFMMD